ncbi:MAG: carboxypeptidase-like regulatory domain-containing protein [Paludibacteraceae bacterium]|nr:carboxypeptidase-like regulatory domain-containing protein [Paludibacteraceae bacterium]
MFLVSCVQHELNMYGGISGVVKDAESNQPLPGVRVSLSPTGLSQVTEKDGQFTFTELEPNDYTMTFEKAGYLGQTTKVTVVADISSSVQIALQENQLGIDIRPYSLNFGATTQTLQLKLTSDGRTIHYKAETSANWISLIRNSGSVTTQEVLTISVARAGLAAGEYTGDVRISVEDKYLTIPVTMLVEGAALPQISLEGVTAVNATEVQLTGVLQSVGTIDGVSEYGVCYSLQSKPTTDNDCARMGSSKQPKDFTCNIAGLTMGKTYYFRAYAVNSQGVAYSEQLTVQTIAPPELGELSVKSVGVDKVVVSGSLKSVGTTGFVTDYGICYSLQTAPTRNSEKLSLGSTSNATNIEGVVDGLVAQTVYYLRAYAVYVSNGLEMVVYSNQVVAQTTKQTTQQPTEDYSSAKISTGNGKLAMTLLSCLRAGNRVTIEATLLNKSISPDNSFSTVSIGNSNTAGLTHVEDNLFTDYAWTSLMVYLNNASGHNLPSTPLPIGSTKRLTLTIDGVPQSAQTISVYIAAEFYYTTPTEYCYLTFENVPIY